MRCNHCGFENLEKATFCSGCGKPLEEMNELVEMNHQIEEIKEDKTQTFEKTNRKVLIGVILFLILGLVVSGIYLVTKPNVLEVAKESYLAGEFESYEKAKKKFNSEQTEEFNRYIIDEANQVLESFKADALYYKDANRRLENIKSYAINSEEIAKLIEQLESLNNSRTAYHEGKGWLEAKEWENARDSFLLVISSDPNYDSAIKYLESITRWQLQEIGAKASEYVELNDYEKALAEIEKGLEIDPENEILLNLVDAIELAMTQPPVEEEIESTPGFGESIKSGLESLGESIKSFFSGILFGN